MERTIQETTSTYFNKILKKRVTPISIRDIDSELLASFTKAVEEAFTEDSSLVMGRIEYLVPYIIQNIDWVEYGIPLEGWQLKYYYQRDRFMKVTGLKYEDFKAHGPFMDSIVDLGLTLDPVFEFVLFLCYYYHQLRGDLRYSPIEQLEKLQAALHKENPDVSMDVVVDGKHFKFNNSSFVKQLIDTVDKATLCAGSFRNNFDEGSNRDKIRALDYYLIKTLLDYLPIKAERKKGKYSQAERNFSLSVLNLCGRLQGDDPEIICTQFNNATFDKLMRDFKDSEIPFAMELFL